jgi:hypothetical protein
MHIVLYTKQKLFNFVLQSKQKLPNFVLYTKQNKEYVGCKPYKNCPSIQPSHGGECEGGASRF